MNQISIRIPENEYKLISSWAKEKNISLAAAYKEITSKAFTEWKENYLLLQYTSGRMRLKEAWIQSGLPLMAFMKLLDDNDLEPPHTTLMELKSSEKRNFLTKTMLFKNGIEIKRHTSELEFSEHD